MKNIRTTLENATRQKFYQLPKFLLDERFKGLTNDARVLYALLLDRHELSIKNKWVNERGEVYMLYLQEKMAVDIGTSKRTIARAISKLEEHGLITQERQGKNKPNKIYLHTIESDKTTASLENTGSVNLAYPEESSETLGSAKFTSQDMPNLPPNLTNINKTREEIENILNTHSGEMSKLDKKPLTDDNELYEPPSIDCDLPWNESIFKQAESYGKARAKWALNYVDWFIDKAYPSLTGYAHPQLVTLSKARRMSFALKICECMANTSAEDETDMIDALNFVIKNRHAKYSNIDPTIFWLTTPEVMGYGIVKTHENNWYAVQHTDYEPVENVY